MEARGGATPERDRVFVAAPAHRNLASLEKALAEQGMQLVTAIDEVAPGDSQLAAVRRGISSARYVVGLWNGDPDRSNVLFELGVALGLDKPAVLAVDGVGPPVPADLSDLPTVPLQEADYEPLLFALASLAEGGDDTGADRPPPASLLRPLGRDTEQATARVRAARSHAAVVAVLADALRQTGLTVVEDPARDDRADGDDRGGGGFDLGVWASELQATVGNPFLIQVEGRIGGPTELEDHLLQAHGRLVTSSARWAMLLYEEGPDPAELQDESARCRVLLAKVDALLGSLREQTFAGFVWTLRNRLVHSPTD